ncbi:x intrinsic protein [Genlisea aurea]|uniref:X intrinsic protein n=1 Tax=Genlisea aurea TaxID=192259 RepID=S8E4H4_9LAMI|nr:x intrinsic protein [Genlisea aurea]
MLGVKEFISLELWRSSAGELLASAVLTFMLDAVIIATTETITEMQGLILSILVGVTFTIVFLAMAPISGACIDPMVTVSAALIGLISITRALVYTVAQCLGGILGALALKSVIAAEYADAFSLCGCTVTVISPAGVEIGLGVGKAFLMEFICSFVVQFMCLWMAYDFRQIGEYGRVKVFTIVGIVVALVVFVSISVTGAKGYSGAAMNPARCFGSAVVRSGHLWDGHWVFWVGPIFASVAFYLYTKIISREHYQVKPYDHDFFNVIDLIYRGRRTSSHSQPY